MKARLKQLYMQWCYHNDHIVARPGIHDQQRLDKREAIYAKITEVCPDSEVRKTLLAEIHDELYPPKGR